MARKRKSSKPDKPKSNVKNDAYTGMLTMSLLALAGGCVLLYLDFQKYGENTKPPTVPKVQPISIDDLEAAEEKKKQDANKPNDPKVNQ